MGMIVYVYRAGRGGDSTNGGISSQVDALTVVNVDGPFDPDVDRPAVLLKEGPYNTARLVPAEKVGANYDEVPGWYMYGGNAASTSDSRWSRAIEEMFGAKFDFVKIFDRIEA